LRDPLPRVFDFVQLDRPDGVERCRHFSVDPFDYAQDKP
jgi:hypothetical protein